MTETTAQQSEHTSESPAQDSAESKKIQHTPGPWDSKNFYIVQKDNPRLCIGDSHCINAEEYPDYETTLANARLMAAAPSMYALLESRAKDGDIELQQFLRSSNGNA